MVNLSDGRNWVIRKRNELNLIEELSSNVLVSSVDRNLKRIKVVFKYGLRENWLKFTDNSFSNYSNIIFPDNFLDGSNDVIISRQFKDVDFPFIPIIKRRRFNRGSFVARRLAVHRFIDYVISNRCFLSCPNSVVLEHMEDIVRTIDSKMIVDVVHVDRVCGLLLSFIFTDMVRGRSEYFSPKFLHAAIGYCIRRDRSISLFNIYRFFRYYYRVPFVSPVVYSVILKKLGFGGTVIADPFPSVDGSRFIGSVLGGCSSFHCDYDYGDLVGVFNCDCGGLDRGSYDVVWLDYGFKWCDRVFDDMAVWSKRADFVLVYVPHDKEHLFGKPRQRLVLDSGPWSESFDSLYVF